MAIHVRRLGWLAIFVVVCFTLFWGRSIYATTSLSNQLCSVLGSCRASTANLFSVEHTPITLEGYGDFTGRTVNTTFSGVPLPNPVDAWLGIEYAKQPVGEGRFKPASWPPAFDGVKQATAYGKSCVQDSRYVGIEFQGEDCLNFNVYRTQGVPLDKKLPVFVYIHGGSFNFGSSKSLDGAAFVSSSKAPIVVISFHYRLNSLGSLPSLLFSLEGLLNLGIRDQYFFLRHFVQKHVGSFGGDPSNITLGGRSAGAHSVGIHYFHNYGQNAGKPYFARTILQSGSVTARAFPGAGYPLYVRQFEEYMRFLHCPLNDNVAAMACLRSAKLDDIRKISSKLLADSNYNNTWPFQPVQGGPLLEKFGSQSGYDRTFFLIPTLTTTVTDEGRFAMPGNLETNEDFLKYMHAGSPSLNARDLELLASLYPDPVTDATSPFKDSPRGAQYTRLSAAWSDYAYICPGQETAYRVAAAGIPVWKARFNTNNSFPAWRGIPHAADGKYTWPEPKAQHPEIGHILHGYLASFIATGDPNALRYPGSPEWPNYEPQGYGLDSEAALQLVIQPDDTKVELDDIRREACLFWRDPERTKRLNK
ncbi:alpha/beta-hydrolase [Hypoxylon fragiforme]|uniref:alpha/beta-hydrolase n=1 Tax=Hypoxylon fragiforme TaxID=63214 RepID=UPI0020C63B2B|nr:alpha/beta-hydrolase [Hypoxylon fragiforme]KAI2607060.1 alpha/beta-hydrolase [Hypoxylon fragiforme]